jgi:hypothetical protein
MNLMNGIPGVQPIGAVLALVIIVDQKPHSEIIKAVPHSTLRVLISQFVATSAILAFVDNVHVAHV